MQPNVRSLDELYRLQDPVFSPLRQNYTSQIAQQSASVPDLEKPIYNARDAAFRDIGQMASNKGMLFSGFTPAQQAKYTGEKFLPALTNLRATVQGNIGKLQEALLGLDSEQRKQAQSMREQDLARLYEWQQQETQRKFQAEQQAQQLAQQMKVAQMQIGASRASSSANAEAKAREALLKQYKVDLKENNAGYKFSGPNGAPVSMYQYASITGNSMLDLLRNSPSQYDKNAYNDAMALLQKGASEQQVLGTLQQKYKLLF